MNQPMPELVHGDARNLPLPDDSVDLIVTSPPYFGLRDYGTDGQLGAEPSPGDYIKALIECTAEMVRVLKPSGSIFVNLGDKYAQKTERSRNGLSTGLDGGKPLRDASDTVTRAAPSYGVPAKSLTLLPERYRIAAVDELGLIARAVLIWSKPNGLPESVTDRVRRSHEDWVHLVKSPKYFASVDEIREPNAASTLARAHLPRKVSPKDGVRKNNNPVGLSTETPGTVISASYANPLGKLPGSVWSIPTQPLRVPAELGIDHFAAFPMEWPRRLILGWSPREVCTVCGEGRRPVVAKAFEVLRTYSTGKSRHRTMESPDGNGGNSRDGLMGTTTATITGYTCACPDTTAPSTPGVVLDPFGGTGTTALVAAMNGRRGISVDLSEDYQRLAEWRAQDPKQRAKAGAA